MPRLERPPRFLMDGTRPRFWPPRPNRFWAAALWPVHFYFSRFMWRLAGIEVEGVDRALAPMQPGDGVLLAPNHSADGDGYIVMKAGRPFARRMYFMAAWQVFCRYFGLAGWAIQRMGGFSVDREGSDRRAMRQSADILTRGQTLLVFPEGEVYHLSRRLRPLLEGVAFMAITAQRAMVDRRVWIVPTAIHYQFVEDVLPRLEHAMTRLERRMLRVPSDQSVSLSERIVRYGELLLTMKEKEKLGGSREKEGDLPARIAYLTDTLLKQHEETPSTKPVPQRARLLRRPLLETWADEDADPDLRTKARSALDDIQLAMQLYSYPGDYVTQDPTVERMAETIEKFEEDVFWLVRPKGRRKARVVFADPIDMSQQGQGRAREIAANVTDQLTAAIQGMLDA